MGSLSRNYSIASCHQAMRKMGVEAIVDFTIKSGFPNELIEHVAQSSLLRDQDRWVCRLPVAEMRQDPPPTVDIMTIKRFPTEPILSEENPGEHSGESLEENCDQESSELVQEDIPSELDAMLLYGEGHANGGLEGLIE
jgi:hypothetical protein